MTFTISVLVAEPPPQIFCLKLQLNDNSLIQLRECCVLTVGNPDKKKIRNPHP